MLYGTAHDDLTSDAPARLPGNRLSGLAANDFMPRGLRGLRGLAATPLTASWIVEPTYARSLVSTYGTIPFTVISGYNSMLPLLLVSQTTQSSSSSQITQQLTLSGASGYVVTLSITITIPYTKTGYTPAYSVSVNSVNITQNNAAPAVVPTSSAPVVKPGATAPVVAPVTTTASTVTSPPLDPGFKYVLPIGAALNGIGVGPLLGVADSDLASLSSGWGAWQVTTNFILTSSPGIVQDGGNSTIGFSIPPSQISDVWEIYSWVVDADPNKPYIQYALAARNLTQQGDPIVWTWTSSSGNGIQLSKLNIGQIAEITAAVIVAVVAAVLTAGAGAAAGGALVGATVATVAETAAVSAAVVEGVQATIQIASGQSFGSVLEGAAITGVVTGVAVDLAAAISTAVSTPPTAANAPQVADTSLPTDGGSLLAPDGATDTLTVTSSSGESLAPTAASGASTVSSSASNAVTTAGSALVKAAGATAVSTAAAALSAEIKKLSGQVPASVGSYIPGSTAPATVAASTTTAPSTAISGKTILALGGVGLLALLKKK